MLRNSRLYRKYFLRTSLAEKAFKNITKRNLNLLRLRSPPSLSWFRLQLKFFAIRDTVVEFVGLIPSIFAASSHCLLIPHQGLPLINRHAPFTPIHLAKLYLRRPRTLLCGLEVPILGL